MQLWGKTVVGKQRFRCSSCHLTSIAHRPDSRQRAYQRLFIRWITTSVHLIDLAKQLRMSVRTLLRHFQPLWQCCPAPLTPEATIVGIVLDAVGIVPREQVALIVQNPIERRPVTWSFASQESVHTWLPLIHSLAVAGVKPRYAVCDGQRGLNTALLSVWPTILIQRCMIHVVRHARLLLTRRPQTQAGQVLFTLVKELLGIRTRRQQRRWLHRYRRWQTRYDHFLKERTDNPWSKRHWWYTHRKLRAARSLITHSLPYLFTFVRYPEIPRTSNHVEGGINSRIKDLLKIHRGLSPDRQRVLVAWYLKSRQIRKPTRNVY